MLSEARCRLRSRLHTRNRNPYPHPHHTRGRPDTLRRLAPAPCAPRTFSLTSGGSRSHGTITNERRVSGIIARIMSWIYGHLLLTHTLSPGFKSLVENIYQVVQPPNPQVGVLVCQ